MLQYSKFHPAEQILAHVYQNCIVAHILFFLRKLTNASKVFTTRSRRRKGMNIFYKYETHVSLRSGHKCDRTYYLHIYFELKNFFHHHFLNMQQNVTLTQNPLSVSIFTR